MSGKLTHLDSKGNARMVDVGIKPKSMREAVAEGSVYMSEAALELIADGRVPKGDVLAVARIAGIMASKRTPELIPLCHPLNLTNVEVDLSIDNKKNRVVISAKAKTNGQTGVEMEALTAVSVAGLAVYDMCKAISKEMTIGDISLIEKKGGKSGHYKKKLR